METDQEERDDTLFISKKMLGDKECKPGEILKFKVVSVDDDDVEVSLSGYGEGDEEMPDWRTDLRENAGEEASGPTEVY